MRRAIDGYEDVIWLQIAMDNKVSMRVLHRIKNLEKQSQTVRNGKRFALAKRGDWGTIHILHYEKELAGLGDAAVEQSRNKRMAQPG